MAYDSKSLGKRYGIHGLNEGEDTELILTDDADEIVDSLGGALCFSEENSDGDFSVQKFEGTKSKSQKLNIKTGFDPTEQVSHRAFFEIVDATVIKEGRTKFVSYSVGISNSTNADSSVAMIDRRYSQFEKLNLSLKKKFSNLMKDVSFPRKTVIGNFSAETIAQRSRAFEQYLTHVSCLDEIRYSQEFAQFFFLEDLIAAHEKIQSGQFNEALPTLQNCVHLQKKILGDDHPDVIASLCALVVTCSSTNQDHLAQIYADAALQCIGSDKQSRYLVPLLQASIRLCWKLGKDKKDLEARLAELKRLGCDIESSPTLLELITRRFSK